MSPLIPQFVPDSVRVLSKYRTRRRHEGDFDAADDALALVVGGRYLRRRHAAVGYEHHVGERASDVDTNLYRPTCVHTWPTGWGKIKLGGAADGTGS